MKNIYKIYQDAPPLGKIIMLLMVCVLAYFIYHFVSKALTPKPDNQNLLDSSKNELNQLQQGGQIPTYSDSQFNGWADSLYTAMDGFGTDEDAITGVFHYMQNKADVLKLIKSFGIRKRVYNAFVVAGDDLNLNQWLTEEVTAETLSAINNELKTKNINYSF